MPLGYRRKAIFGISLIGALATLLCIQLFKDSPRSQPRPAPNVRNALEKTLSASIPEPASPRRDRDYWPQVPQPVSLHSRQLLPSFDAPADVSEDQRVVWLLQFGGPLHPADLEELRRRQVDMLLPTLACTFHVRASLAALRGLARDFSPTVLGWSRLQGADKCLPALKTWLGSCAHKPSKTELRLELYPDANVAALRAFVLKAGGAIVSGETRALNVAGPATIEFALALANLEDVYALDLVRGVRKVLNSTAAAASNIAPVQNAPRNLSGSAIPVMVRDGGKIFDHPDLAARVTFAPDVAALGTTLQHTTHVAGTIGGTGSLNVLAKGMAPSCTLVNYDFNGDDTNEVLQARSAYGTVISNHSYGLLTGWEGATFTDNQANFGSYTSFGRNWDSLVYSDNLILVKGSGNDRNDSGAGQPHDGTLAADGEYYDCIDPSGTAKNILCIGAVRQTAQAGTPSASKLVMDESSSGPTNDGRLKPELVADGELLLSSNNSATVGNEYTSLSGTSVACAVATGATALFVQRYQQLMGAGKYCTAHFLRAAFAQTATDLGRSGPDYLHGFGMLDLQAAIALLDLDNGTGAQLLNQTVSATAPERFFVLISDGLTPIKLSLCWTDAPGDLLASKAIVNDLDLRLIRASDGTVSYPFTLSFSAPQAVATTGVNSVDTLEQLIESSPAAGTYLLAVRGTTLAAPTAFTVASSHVLFENIAPLARMVATPTTGTPPLLVSFEGTQSLDPDGSVVRYLWDFGDGTNGEGASVQHTYSAGSYQAQLTVVDDLGATASMSVSIGVANKAPSVAISATPESGPSPLNVLLSSSGSIDSDGTIVDYQWDLGDGTTAAGPEVSHTYSLAGLYVVTLTVTDNGGAQATKSSHLLVGQSIIPNSGRLCLKFNKIFSDSFSVYTRSLPIDPGLQVAAMAGQVRIGSGLFNFVLDEAGNYKGSALSVKLVPAKSQLRVKISRTKLDTALANSGASNRTTSKESIRVPFAVYLPNGQVFGSSGLPFSYTAKQSISGTGKLVLP